MWSGGAWWPLRFRCTVRITSRHNEAAWFYLYFILVNAQCTLRMKESGDRDNGVCAVCVRVRVASVCVVCCVIDNVRVCGLRHVPPRPPPWRSNGNVNHDTVRRGAHKQRAGLSKNRTWGEEVCLCVVMVHECDILKAMNQFMFSAPLNPRSTEYMVFSHFGPTSAATALSRKRRATRPSCSWPQAKVGCILVVLLGLLCDVGGG